MKDDEKKMIEKMFEGVEKTQETMSEEISKVQEKNEKIFDHVIELKEHVAEQNGAIRMTVAQTKEARTDAKEASLKVEGIRAIAKNAQGKAITAYDMADKAHGRISSLVLKLLIATLAFASGLLTLYLTKVF